MSTESNPFRPIEVWDDIRMKINDDGEEKFVDAKHFHVRFIIGESNEKRFVDQGEDHVHEISNRTIYVAPSIHRVPGDSFHYDITEIEPIIGEDRIQEKSKMLSRSEQCDSPELVEIAYVAPGVECCELTKEEADRRQIPLKYVAGYLLGTNNGVFKVALSKTVLESGHAYYAHVHIVPESAIVSWSCLE